MENVLFHTAVHKLTTPQTINAVKTPMSLKLLHQDAGVTYKYPTSPALVSFLHRAVPHFGFLLPVIGTSICSRNWRHILASSSTEQTGLVEPVSQQTSYY